MNDVVIASAARTAIGTFGGGLSSLSGAELGEIVIREALLRATVSGVDVDEVVLGQVKLNNNDVLDEKDLANNLTLSCQAVPLTSELKLKYT